MLPGAFSLPPMVWDLVSKAIAPFQASQRPKIVRGNVTLEADKAIFLPDSQRLQLNGNVEATYEKTKLKSDSAEINLDKEQGRFSQGVQLIDQIGTLSANELSIDYKNYKGYARGIKLRAYEAYLEGEELIIDKDSWRLRNAWFTTCLGHYRVNISDVVIRTGRNISARRSSLEINRVAKIPLPFFRVGLNPREIGFQAPVPSMEEGFKFGYRWNNSFALGDATTLHINQVGGQRRIPSTDLQLTYSLIPRGDVPGILTPRSQDFERFTDGYMDDVNVKSLKQEDEVVGQKRAFAFVGHTTNITTRARPGTPEALDRPAYIGFEAAAQLAGISMNGQIRYGTIKQRLSSQTFSRTEAYATMLLPAIPLSSVWSLRFRADAAVFSGETRYAWFRPLAALVFRPSDRFQFTVAGFAAQTSGTPFFNDDRLFSSRAMHLRADISAKSFDLSLLAKYDFDKDTFYDYEARVGLAADCIRPFINYRKFPGSFGIGFTLRADKLLEALKRRQQTREQLPPP